MANAFSDTITKDDISFYGQSVISNLDAWHTEKGSITYGNTINMGADSRCVVNKAFNNEKIDYLKFKVKLDSDDHTLSTDNGHAVTGLCTATYIDENNQVLTNQYHFYPKYVFEDDYQDDYTIIQLGANQRLTNLKVELINKEDVPVKILETGMNVSKVIDEETLGELVENTIVNNETVKDAINRDIDSRMEDKMSDYYGDMVESVGTYIEPRTSDPSGTELYAGRIWLREDLVS